MYSKIAKITSFLIFVILCICTQSKADDDLGNATKTCQNIAVNFSTLISCKPNTTRFVEDKDENLVTVCRIGKKKVLIKPFNFLWLDGSESVYHSFLTDKFYTTFKVQLTSSRILDEISRRPEFNNTQVSFMDVTEVRFVLASSEFFPVRSDIQLNQEWKRAYETISEDKFTRLQFNTSSRDIADELRRKSTMYGNSLSGEIDIYKRILRIQLKVANDPDILEASLKSTYLCENSKTLDKGIPKLYPTNPNKPWILIQRRETPGIDFNRSWIEYKYGFGDWRNDFWLGLEKIYRITKDGGYGLRMEFESHKGLLRAAQWENFRVSSEEDKYRLYISGFDTNSSAGSDRMAYSNGGEFATVDKDNHYSYAKKFGGGWWFTYGTMQGHFNSQLRSRIENSVTCVHYNDFKGSTYRSECLKGVKMFIIKQ